MTSAAKRLGLVGCGRIGAPVLAAWQAGRLPGWEVCSVLVRRADAGRGPLFVTDLAAFLATQPELVVELAGPPALATLGDKLLRRAELWTVSGAALADETLLRTLHTVGHESGHRLRVLAGAFAGLDGVSAAAAAPGTTLTLSIDLPPGPAPAGCRFKGSVREAARHFPNAVNVAVAAALAGPGLDLAQIVVQHPGPVARHRLVLQAESAAGSLRVEVEPELGQGVHPVACSVIAALQREMQVVWAG